MSDKSTTKSALEALSDYVVAAQKWNRAINMRLSPKTREARGKKAESAYQNLVKILKESLP